MNRLGFVLGTVLLSAVASRDGGARLAPKPSGGCGQVSFEGEVRAGQTFVHPLDKQLEVQLEAIASGWVLRVRPSSGESLRHDYAELATPPYASVNPLLISTDYSFRAQDAVGWNPRRFAFAAGREEFGQMLNAYDRYMSGKTAYAGQTELTHLVVGARQGTFTILDAHLVPGVADQWKMAAGVATHFATTAHTIEASQNAQTPLGKILWMRFRVTTEKSDCRRETK